MKLKYISPIWFSKYTINLFGFLFVKEKTFQLGTRRVTLLGMSHVGRHSFYAGIKRDYENSDAVTLSEGVGDKKNILKGRLKYKKLSKLVGLDNQKRGIFSKEVIRSDLDVSEFDKKTIKFLKALSKVLSLTLAQVVRGQKKLTEELKGYSKREFDGDLLKKRNDYLWFKFLENRDRENILIPWGASHLPDIESRLLEIGYRQVKTKYRLFAIVPTIIYRCIRYLIRRYPELKRLSKSRA